MVQIKREPLSFGNHQQSGHEELAGANPLAVNVIVDAAGAVHRRPGIAPRDDGDPATPPDFAPNYVSSVSGIVLLHVTAAGRVFAVDGPTVAAARIYELRGSNTINLSAFPYGELVGGRRPIIAETEAMLVITAGAKSQKVLLNAPAVSSRLPGGSPLSSHVIAHASRLLMNDVLASADPDDVLVSAKNTIHFSGRAAGSSTAGHEDWTSTAAGFFNADARPDPVVALHENGNEVFAFGTTNLQVFAATTDVNAPYAPSNTREFGCSAPYSIIKYDQSFAFIDSHRRIMTTDGREYQYISSDIQQTLDDIYDLSDMIGYRVTLGPVDALCWYCPKDGRTFAYQAANKGWSLWMGWSNFSFTSYGPPTVYGSNNFSPWMVRSALRVPQTGQMLVGTENKPLEPASGSITRGGVFSLSNRTYCDFLTESLIVARVDTGFVDRGTGGRKLCRALRLTWRGTPSTDTAAFVQWRDDGGPWEDPRQVEITQNSESILRPLGVYRRRQWRVTFSGSAELVLARAEEEFELLAT